MTGAADALSATQQTEYAVRGRADLDRRLERLTGSERDAFWKAVRSAYVVGPRSTPAPRAGGARRRAASRPIQEVCR